MNWRASLSDSDKREMYQDSCAAFQSADISEETFRKSLVELGYNATDIEEAVKFYRPEPPENDMEV